MKHFLGATLIIGALLLCSGTFAHADIFCVDNSADLQAKLTLAASNGTDDEIRLVSGSYAISSNSNNNFTYDSGEDFSLVISGGWNSSCQVQTFNPALTVLNGETIQVSANGGVLSIKQYNTLPVSIVISNLSIRNGNTLGFGGGLYFLHYSGSTAPASLNISLVNGENNHAGINGGGGGFEIYDDASAGGLSVQITDCIVQSNTAVYNPGGIDISGGNIDMKIEACRILNNAAASPGGGLYLDSGSGNASLINNIIAGNSATSDIEGDGGGVFIYNSAGGNYTFTNNTIVANAAAVSGGGVIALIANDTTQLSFHNNIIYGNTALDTTDLYIDNDFNLNDVLSPVVILNNDFDQSAAGFTISDPLFTIDPSNLDNANPLFADSANDNYRLTASSPCIDKGDNSAQGLPATDIDGNPRILDGDNNGSAIVDMGAYEFVTFRIGIFRNGYQWYLDTRGDGVWGSGDTYSAFGSATAADIPVTGDWDGDGKTEIGIFRNGYQWYLDVNGNGVWDQGDAYFAFGSATPADTPVTGDWDGDGRTEIGIFRNGYQWYLDVNGDGVWDQGDAYFAFGSATPADTPVTGKW